MTLHVASRIKDGLSLTTMQPRFLVVGTFVVVLPLLFVYTGQTFLEAGVANQDKLQRDQVDTLHDSIAALITAASFDPAYLETFTRTLRDTNPSVVELRFVREEAGDFIVLKSYEAEGRSLVDATPDAYRSAQIRFGETTIFPFALGNERYYQAVRAFESQSMGTFYVLSVHSLAATDRYLKANEYRAYLVLFGVYVILLLIAWWHARQVDFEHRYKTTLATLKTRDQFTNVVAHELRAPLTAMRGYASMIQESPSVNQEVVRYATTISDASERLLTIVNDLLEVARLQSGTLSLTREPISLGPILNQVLTDLTPSAQEKQITLSYDAPAAVSVLGDDKRLMQVFTNLVSNAIKYTPSGSITLRTAPVRDALEIRIEDTGMGIAAEDQEKLFAPFFRVTNEATETITGTGLGMWITKQLIERMGGTVRVESIKGVGTHVVVRLPLAPV